MRSEFPSFSENITEKQIKTALAKSKQKAGSGRPELSEAIQEEAARLLQPTKPVEKASEFEGSWRSCCVSHQAILNISKKKRSTVSKSQWQVLKDITKRSTVSKSQWQVLKDITKRSTVSKSQWQVLKDITKRSTVSKSQWQVLKDITKRSTVSKSQWQVLKDITKRPYL